MTRIYASRPSDNLNRSREFYPAIQWLKTLLATIFFLLVLPIVSLPFTSLDQAIAADEMLVFSTPDKKQLYQKLARELRCLKCQNQNLADSPAGIAEDLKREIFLMVEEGKSSAHITDFMVSRYGDFILYKPAIKPLTLVLWLAPFVLMAAGLTAIVRLSGTGGRSNKGQMETDSLSGNSQSPDEPPADESAALQKARGLLHAESAEAEASADTHISR